MTQNLTERRAAEIPDEVYLTDEDPRSAPLDEAAATEKAWHSRDGEVEGLVMGGRMVKALLDDANAEVAELQVQLNESDNLRALAVIVERYAANAQVADLTETEGKLRGTLRNVNKACERRGRLIVAAEKERDAANARADRAEHLADIYLEQSQRIKRELDAANARAARYRR